MKAAAIVMALLLASTARAAQAQAVQAQAVQAQAVQAQAGISRGVVVQPESVTVGDPFRVVVRLRAPKGAVIEFPSAPDSGTGVELLDPVQVIPSIDTTAVEQSATYRLAAWDVGRLAIRLPDVIVTEEGGVRRVPFRGDLSIMVGSVLPADSAQRLPKPPRALFEFGPPWWWWVVVGLIAALIIALLWWWRRRRHGVVEPPLSPWMEAQKAFERIDDLDLVASGERGQYVALMADVVRAYLARVIAPAGASLTTTELGHTLRSEPRVPLSRLMRLLHEVDLVKFAAHEIATEQALELGKESRELVDAVEAASHPAPEQSEAA